MITVHTVWVSGDPTKYMPWPSPYRGHAVMYIQEYLMRPLGLKSLREEDLAGQGVYIRSFVTDALSNQMIRHVWAPMPRPIVRMNGDRPASKHVVRIVSNLRNHPRYPDPGDGYHLAAPNVAHPALIKDEPDPFSWRGEALIDGELWEVGGNALSGEESARIRKGTSMVWIALKKVVDQ